MERNGNLSRATLVHRDEGFSGTVIKPKELGAPDRQRETAQYLSDMILELRNLAKSAKLFQVLVPLEYAYYEAFGLANKVDVSDTEVERIKGLEKAGAAFEGTEES